jgi:hypothetical protein
VKVTGGERAAGPATRARGIVVSRYLMIFVDDDFVDGPSRTKLAFLKFGSIFR